MSADQKSRKRVLVALVMLFLVVGGGIFVFFIYQGLGALPGRNKSVFDYTFASGEAVLPLFQYFGLDEENKPAGPMRDRGLHKEPGPDISDWMAKANNTDDGKQNAPATAPAVPVGNTIIPSMSGVGAAASGAGAGHGAGGGSQTTSGISKFSAGDSSGDVSISGRTGGKADASGKGGAMSALANARAFLGDGLRSGSAMAARSKWGQAFGLGPGGGKGELLAYGKPQLVDLDTIKSGEIGSLKTTDAGTLKPSPVKDPESEAKDSNLAKMNGEQGKDAAKDALTDALKAVGGQTGAKDQKTGKDVELPPKEVVDIATTEPPKGTFCPKGCGQGSEHYKDGPPTYAKNDKGVWQATYAGNQGNVAYKDTVEIHPENPAGQQIKPVGTLVNDGGMWKPAEFGGTDPIATP